MKPLVVAGCMAAGGFVLSARAGLAHDGQPPEPHDLWTVWAVDPWAWVALIAVAALYGRGVRGLWTQAGVGRGVRVWQVAAGVGALAALFVALISPLDAVGSALLTAHMVQHELLVAVAAPLLVLGRWQLVVLWGTPVSARSRLVRWWQRVSPLRQMWSVACRPLTAWLLHTAALWVWHAPPLYQLAIETPAVHVAEHLSFFGTGLLFWWTVLPISASGRARAGIGFLSTFALMLQMGVLGALMTFAPTPWYPIYEGRTLPWGLTVLEDQILAGIVMWVLGGMAYALGALGLLALAIRAPRPVQESRHTVPGQTAVEASGGWHAPCVRGDDTGVLAGLCGDDGLDGQDAGASAVQNGGCSAWRRTSP